MKTITWSVPAIVAGNPITIPTTEPDIDAVVAAVICRLPSALTIPNHLAAAIQAAAPVDDHPEADVVAALDDHAVHGHDITTVAAGIGGAALTEPAAPGALETAGAGQTNPAAVDALALPQGHAVSPVPAPVIHGFGAGAPVVHGASVGADPIVTPTVLQKVNARQIRFTITNTVLGDLLALSYLERGERVLAS